MKLKRRVIDSTTNKIVQVDGKYVQGNSHIYYLIHHNRFILTPPHEHFAADETVIIRTGFDGTYTQAHRKLARVCELAVEGNGNVINCRQSPILRKLSVSSMDAIRRQTKIKVSADAALLRLNCESR